MLEAFPDIYRWSIREFQGIFPEAEQALIVRAFKGFSIYPPSAEEILAARCRIVMESDEKAFRGDRDVLGKNGGPAQMPCHDHRDMGLLRGRE